MSFWISWWLRNHTNGSDKISTTTSQISNFLFFPFFWIDLTFSSSHRNQQDDLIVRSEGQREMPLLELFFYILDLSYFSNFPQFCSGTSDQSMNNDGVSFVSVHRIIIVTSCGWWWWWKYDGRRFNVSIFYDTNCISLEIIQHPFFAQFFTDVFDISMRVFFGAELAV